MTHTASEGFRFGPRGFQQPHFVNVRTACGTGGATRIRGDLDGLSIITLPGRGVYLERIGLASPDSPRKRDERNEDLNSQQLSLSVRQRICVLFRPKDCSRWIMTWGKPTIVHLNVAVVEARTHCQSIGDDTRWRCQCRRAS